MRTDEQLKAEAKKMKELFGKNAHEIRSEKCPVCGRTYPSSMMNQTRNGKRVCKVCAIADWEKWKK